MRVTTSYPMSFDENMFDVYFRYSMKFFSSFVVVIMGYAVDGFYEVIVTSSFPMSFEVFFVVCLF